LVNKFTDLTSGLSRAASKAFVKAVNPSGGVHQFLFSGKKRMTFGTNFDVQFLAFHGRTGFEIVAASAANCNFMIIWMYFGFHFISVSS
jgi:hypothetical protein